MQKLEIAPRLFTENDFVSILMPLLRENGIVRVNETELKKKLYYYYLKKEYKELFQDIVPFQEKSASDRMLNIESGLRHYKTFGSGIVWDSMSPENLILTNQKTLDLSFYRQYLSEEGIKKFYQMAKEFGIRYKAENIAQKPFNIYGDNPNHVYSLCTGKYYNSEYGWQLITDGNIKNIKVEQFPQGHFYYEDPTSSKSEIQLKDVTSTSVEIGNANYVLMQGTENANVKRLKAYTNLVDLDLLKQIANIEGDKCVSLNNEKPYVKKYVLK
jgi:hypothetical protein